MTIHLVDLKVNVKVEFSRFVYGKPIVMLLELIRIVILFLNFDTAVSGDMK